MNNTMDKKAQIIEMRNKIIEALELSYQKLVEFKRYKKSPLIVAKNGEIIEIEPEKIKPKTIYLKNCSISIKAEGKV